MSHTHSPISVLWAHVKQDMELQTPNLSRTTLVISQPPSSLILPIPAHFSPSPTPTPGCFVFLPGRERFKKNSKVRNFQKLSTLNINPSLKLRLKGRRYTPYSTVQDPFNNQILELSILSSIADWLDCSCTFPDR